jgi:phosphoglycerol transferase MdoB-like AlkP superfamily enzyme
MDPRIAQMVLVKTMAGLGIVVAVFALALGGRWLPWLLLIAAILTAAFLVLHALPPAP